MEESPKAHFYFLSEQWQRKPCSKQYPSITTARQKRSEFRTVILKKENMRDAFDQGRRHIRFQFEGRRDFCLERIETSRCLDIWLDVLIRKPLLVVMVCGRHTTISADCLGYRFVFFILPDMPKNDFGKAKLYQNWSWGFLLFFCPMRWQFYYKGYCSPALATNSSINSLAKERREDHNPCMYVVPNEGP